MRYMFIQTYILEDKYIIFYGLNWNFVSVNQTNRMIQPFFIKLFYLKIIYTFFRPWGNIFLKELMITTSLNYCDLMPEIKMMTNTLNGEEMMMLRSQAKEASKNLYQFHYDDWFDLISNKLCCPSFRVVTKFKTSKTLCMCIRFF